MHLAQSPDGLSFFPITGPLECDRPEGAVSSFGRSQFLVPEVGRDRFAPAWPHQARFVAANVVLPATNAEPACPVLASISCQQAPCSTSLPLLPRSVNSGVPRA